jgi:hypothetical protein
VPNRIDRSAMKSMKTPEPWRSRLKEPEVQVLSIADGRKSDMPGWCTTGDGLEDSPELEVMCGGINSKTPQHAAIWRQGNLLHFGFQETPDQLNATGKAMLENAVVYIAKFKNDLPIAVTPSVFTNAVWPRTRLALDRALLDRKATMDALVGTLAKTLAAELRKQPVEEVRTWLKDHHGYLAAGPDGLLVIDPDAERLGKAIDSPVFLPAAVAAAGAPATGAEAIRLLARRVPDGPGASADATAWAEFLAENQDYLFFSESSGQVWRLDPLARSRKTPSAQLRGPARATPRK